MINPRTIQNRLQLDMAVVKQLKKGGDDSRQVHKIDHHFFAASAEGLAALAPLTKALGMQPREVKQSQRGDGTVQFSLDVQDTAPTALGIAVRNSLMMLALSEAFRCTYDGWGTFIVKAATPAAD